MLLFSTNGSSANVTIWPPWQVRMTDIAQIYRNVSDKLLPHTDFEHYTFQLQKRITFNARKLYLGVNWEESHQKMFSKSVLLLWFWANITCRVYPGSHWKDITLFIWRRSPTLMPFIGTTGSGQLVRDTADSIKSENILAKTGEKNRNYMRKCCKNIEPLGRKAAAHTRCHYPKWPNYLLLYSSLNPAADTLISEKKWRYNWLEVLLRSAGTVVPRGED